MNDLGLPYGAILGPFSLIDLLSVLIVAFTCWVPSGPSAEARCPSGART